MKFTPLRPDKTLVKSTQIENSGHSDRILFICLHSPFETNAGAQQRTRLLFLALQRYGHVDLVCFTEDALPENVREDGFTIRYFGPLPKEFTRRTKILLNKLKIWRHQAACPHNTLAVKVVRRLIKIYKYDWIVARYVETVFLSGLYHLEGLIIDADDLPWERIKTYRKNKSLPLKTRLFYAYDYLISKKYMKSCMEKAKHVFVANKDHATTPNSIHLPNIPMFPKGAPAEAHHRSTGQPAVLFVGTLDYKPNLWGVDHFVRNVWTKVVAVIPDARFLVVGKGLVPEIADRWLQVKGICLLGFVPNLYQVYQQSSVVVAPIYHGSGTNIKVLEAMAYGKACVASEFSLRGLDHLARNNETILLAEDDHSFARAILSLLKDPVLGTRLGHQASQVIRNNCSVEVFNQAVDTAFFNSNISFEA